MSSLASDAAPELSIRWRKLSGGTSLAPGLMTDKEAGRWAGPPPFLPFSSMAGS